MKLPVCSNGLRVGFVGWPTIDGVIDQSAAAGTISTWTGTSGRLIAHSNNTTTTITDSYANFKMNKTDNLGTLTIDRGYSVGSQTFTGGPCPSKGCFVGRNNTSLSITDSYYDSTICTFNSVNSAGYAGTTGLSTASMQTATPFTNWFPIMWTFTGGQYPKLFWQP